MSWYGRGIAKELREAYFKAQEGRTYNAKLLWLVIFVWAFFAFSVWFVNSGPSSRLVGVNESIGDKDFSRNAPKYQAFADCLLNGGNRKQCDKSAPSDEILFFSKETGKTFCGWGSGSLLSENPEVHAYLWKGVGRVSDKKYVYYPQSSPFATYSKWGQVSGSGGVLLTVMNDEWAVCQEPVLQRFE